MTKIPISLFFMTSTKGHHGFKDVWQATLKHLSRQIPLDAFSVKVAHIKITPGEEEFAQSMTRELEHNGFKVLTTTASWQRGTSHQIAYNQDLITVSKEPSLYKNPYVLWLEDDSTLTCNVDSLEKTLYRMVEVLESSIDVVSTRFIRAADFAGGVPQLKVEGDHFFSPNFDFQPAILRSRDFFLAAKFVEAGPDAQRDIQIEMLWRLILNGFTRSVHSQFVWLPSYAESIHLGVPNYQTIKQSLNL